MERLTEWIGEDEDRRAIPRMDLRNIGYEKCCDKLAEYEDLEEAGLLVKLPCKLGDMVCAISRFCSGGIRDCVYAYECSECSEHDPVIVYEKFKITMLSEIGKSVFLTREAAEEKIKELKRHD